MKVLHGCSPVDSLHLRKYIVSNKKCEVEPYFCCPSFLCTRVELSFTRVVPYCTRVVSCCTRVVPCCFVLYSCCVMLCRVNTRVVF